MILALESEISAAAWLMRGELAANVQKPGQ
jgi:hypothetical protein